LVWKLPGRSRKSGNHRRVIGSRDGKAFPMFGCYVLHHFQVSKAVNHFFADATRILDTSELLVPPISFLIITLLLTIFSGSNNFKSNFFLVNLPHCWKLSIPCLFFSLATEKRPPGVAAEASASRRFGKAVSPEGRRVFPKQQIKAFLVKSPTSQKVPTETNCQSLAFCFPYEKWQLNH